MLPAVRCYLSWHGTLDDMQLNLSADEVLKSTRSVRKRLDFDRPVSRAVVEECLDIALQAPTGGNRQGWHWIVIEDPAKKKHWPTSTEPTGPFMQPCRAAALQATHAMSKCREYETRQRFCPRILSVHQC